MRYNLQGVKDDAVEERVTMAIHVEVQPLFKFIAMYVRGESSRSVLHIF